MSTPPATCVAGGPRRQHKRRSDGVAAQTLIRYAHTVTATAGVERSPAWVSRTVRQYVRHGLGRQRFGAYLTDGLDLTRHEHRRIANSSHLIYADPTGETAAVRNVEKESQ